MQGDRKRGIQKKSRGARSQAKTLLRGGARKAKPQLKKAKGATGKLRSRLAAQFNGYFESKCAEAVGRGGRPLSLLGKEAKKAATILAPVKPHTKGRKPLKKQKKNKGSA